MTLCLLLLFLFYVLENGFKKNNIFSFKLQLIGYMALLDVLLHFIYSYHVFFFILHSLLPCFFRIKDF